MHVFEGIAASPGVAIGEAFVLDTEGFRIPQRVVAQDAIQSEIDRLHRAVAQVSDELTRHRNEVASALGEQYGAIFSAQLQMVCDPKLQEELEHLIRDRHYSPEYAVTRTLGRYAKVFQNLENKFMAERAHDIVDIEKRLLRQLLGRRREGLNQLTSPVVILAHNLTPSETANLQREFVLGFVSEKGGAGGHSAIVAKALEIPAVVGTGPILCDVAGGDLVIVDGDNGRVIVQPDEQTIRRYRVEVEQHRTLAHQWEQLRDLPAQTLDGTRITLDANIEFPREVEACRARGADGIGLFRTEFLYLSSNHLPSEEEQYRAYVDVLGKMEGRPVVIRTLDLGADKFVDEQEEYEQRNPFLGLRSIRLSLRNPAIFRTQLRAILRASAQGPVSVMFPLVSTLQELRHAKSMLADTMEDLEEEQIEFNRDIPVGMMVEVPAVILLVDRFVREVDFISIGTNDLIQYTLAVDRSNKDVAALYNACDPSVLRQIEWAVRVANQHGVPCSLCGEMSANPIHTMLLLGMGLRSLSIPPAAIPEVKNVIRNVSIAECQRVAQRVLEMENPREIVDFLVQQLKSIVQPQPMHE